MVILGWGQLVYSLLVVILAHRTADFSKWIVLSQLSSSRHMVFRVQRINSARYHALWDLDSFDERAGLRAFDIIVLGCVLDRPPHSVVEWSFGHRARLITLDISALQDKIAL